MNKIAEHPETQYFDWTKDAPALCIAPIPNHPAYSMGYIDYQRHRTYEDDETKKMKRSLCFRVPPFISLGIPVIARMFGLCAHTFLTVIIEMGLIRTQRDYHDMYSTINTNMTDLYLRATDEDMHNKILQIKKQVIDLGIVPKRCDVYSPTVPDWVYAAVKSTAKEINCSYQDLVLICICKGLLATESDHEIPKMYKKQLLETISRFDAELHELNDRAEYIYSRVKR